MLHGPGPWIDLARVTATNSLRSGVSSVTGPTKLARYPLLMRCEAQRDRVFRELWGDGLGASRLYKATLDELPQVDRFVMKSPVPNAADFARRLLTLPLHSDVSLAHFEQMTDILHGLVGRSVGGLGDADVVGMTHFEELDLDPRARVESSAEEIFAASRRARLVLIHARTDAAGSCSFWSDILSNSGFERVAVDEDARSGKALDNLWSNVEFDPERQNRCSLFALGAATAYGWLLRSGVTFAGGDVL